MGFTGQAVWFWVALAAAGAAHAEAVYRCTDAAGKTSYKDAPCNAWGGNDREKLVNLKVIPAPPAAPASPGSAPRARSTYKEPVRAAMILYYDPANEPMEYPTAVVEGVIRSSMQAWMAGCQVDLQYGGQAPYSADGRIERVSIRWRPDFMRMSHPSDPQSRRTATGGLRSGIELSTRLTELNSLFVHELGHVLGLGHNHEDTSSVMSYLNNDVVRGRAQPSASDYLACNLSMKRMFGNDFTPEPGTRLPEGGRRMTDGEAMERLRRAAAPPKP